MDMFSRTRLLLGDDAIERLKGAKIAVFGIGGVGGFTVEALVRGGVGSIDLIDNDRVSISNLNRQIIATTKTIGEYKTQVARARISEINPDCKVNTFNTFVLPDTISEFDFKEYDYVVDAIDTVSGKLTIVEEAYRADTRVISALGAGNKLDPTAFRVDDIFNTRVCPLARVMRRECKQRGIKSLKCVYSEEKPIQPEAKKNKGEECGLEERGRIPGSVSFVPAVAGLIIAGEVIKDLIFSL